MKNKNILIFCHEFPPIGGGASNALYHLTREWKHLQCDITVVTSHFGDLPKNEIAQGIQVIRIPVGRKQKGRATIWQMIQFIFKTCAKTSYWRKFFRPDHCIGFMTIPAGIPTWMMWLRYKVPYSTCLRGGDVPGFDPDRLRFFHLITQPLIKFIWRSSKYIIANSKGLLDLARKNTSKEIHVIYNGVDADFFKREEDDQLNSESKLIQAIFVGRFCDSQKNISYLIEKLALLPFIQLKLIGSGPDQDYLERACARLHVSERVNFIDWLDRDSLRRELLDSTLYLSSSRWEGTPNTVLEAMASGLICVLSDIPGHRELIQHDKNGLLYDLKDPDGLVDNVERIKDDALLYERLKKQVIQDVRSNYRWSQKASEYEKLIFNE